MCVLVFFFNDTATTEIYTLPLHDALPILRTRRLEIVSCPSCGRAQVDVYKLADEVTAGLEGMEVPLRVAVIDRKSTRLNSSPRQYLVCRLLLEKKKKNSFHMISQPAST